MQIYMYLSPPLLTQKMFNMKYTKITSFSLLKLNNLEFTNFFHRFRLLVRAKGAEPAEGSATLPEADAALLESMDADIATMEDIARQSRISDETAELDELDKQRDDYVVFITSSASAAALSPIEATRRAGTSLSNRLKPYVGIYRLPNQQETAAIVGMLTDLKNPETSPHVTTLHLDEAVAELERLNNLYASLTEQRTQGRISRTLEDTKAVRSRLSDAYEEICTVIHATNVLAPTEATRTFINQVNVLISETSAAYNQRKAQAKKTSK